MVQNAQSFAGRSGATREKMLKQAGDGQNGIPADGEDPGHNTEAYDRINDNPFHAAQQTPLSTFSIDVDTASYTNVRRYLQQTQPVPAQGRRPHRGDGQLLLLQ